MRSISFAAGAAAAAASVLLASPPAAAQFLCDIPTNGCTNGMFNQEKCECECIPPYCPDWFGDCTNPTGSCGGNPWEECTRGEDCPWWANPMKDESCTTGPKVRTSLLRVIFDGLYALHVMTFEAGAGE